MNKRFIHITIYHQKQICLYQGTISASCRQWSRFLTTRGDFHTPWNHSFFLLPRNNTWLGRPCALNYAVSRASFLAKSRGYIRIKTGPCEIQYCTQGLPMFALQINLKNCECVALACGWCRQDAVGKEEARSRAWWRRGHRLKSNRRHKFVFVSLPCLSVAVVLIFMYILKRIGGF